MGHTSLSCFLLLKPVGVASGIRGPLGGSTSIQEIPMDLSESRGSNSSGIFTEKVC